MKWSDAIIILRLKLIFKLNPDDFQVFITSIYKFIKTFYQFTLSVAFRDRFIFNLSRNFTFIFIDKNVALFHHWESKYTKIVTKKLKEIKHYKRNCFKNFAYNLNGL